MATNLRPLVRKLQMALRMQRGRIISISYMQRWSDKAQRAITKYIVSERVQVGGKARYAPVYKGFSLPDLVQALARLYRGEPINDEDIGEEV